MNNNERKQAPEEISAGSSGAALLAAPFADHAAGHFYYAGADGAQRLDLLLHLAPYSPLLVIAGKPGVGKTALLRQFMARAHDSWRPALVTARVDMGRDEWLRDMAQGFGLPLDPRIDHQQLYDALVAQLRALRQNAQVPILLVDDAQYLSASMMELILKLCTENDNGHVLSLVLFGTPQLQNLLDSPAFTSLAARVTHTFEVTPLDEEETGAYIRHRLLAAGAAGDGPFDAMMINRIYAASGGMPARINEMAQRAIHGGTLGDGPSRGKRNLTAVAGPGKRKAVMAVAAVLVVLMIAGPLRTALFKGPSGHATPAAPAAPAPAVTDDERVIREPPAPPATAPGPPAGTRSLPLPPIGATIPEPAPAPPPPPHEEQQAPAAASMPPPPRAGEAAAEATAKGEARPAPSAPTPAVAAPAAVAPEGAAWVRAQPDDHFTLQLMALKEEDTLRDFIALHHLQGQAAYIPVQRTDGTFYALFYGSYPSRIEATRAAKALPPRWGTPNPWIRSFKAVHGELGR